MCNRDCLNIALSCYGPKCMLTCTKIDKSCFMVVKNDTYKGQFCKVHISLSLSRKVNFAKCISLSLSHFSWDLETI